MGFLKNLLGLGVAAGTAYAAVKVAQKYNEKKNANADLNGDGAVDAKDTVYGVKEAAREVYAETAAKVREKAPEVREKAAAAIGAVQEKAPEFIEKVKGAAGEAWSAIHGENFPGGRTHLFRGCHRRRDRRACRRAGDPRRRAGVSKPRKPKDRPSRAAFFAALI